MSGPISIILPGSTIILQSYVGNQQDRSNLPCTYSDQYNVPQVNDMRDAMNNNNEEVIYIKENNIKMKKNIDIEEEDEDESEEDEDEEDEEDEDGEEDDEAEVKEEDNHDYHDHDYRENFDWEMSEPDMHQDPNLNQEMFFPVSNTVSENEADNESSLSDDEDSDIFDPHYCNSISTIKEFLKKGIILHGI